jgi:hypothetical protein
VCMCTHIHICVSNRSERIMSPHHQPRSQSFSPPRFERRRHHHHKQQQAQAEAAAAGGGRKLEALRGVPSFELPGSVLEHKLAEAMGMVDGCCDGGGEGPAAAFTPPGVSVRSVEPMGSDLLGFSFEHNTTTNNNNRLVVLDDAPPPHTHTYTYTNTYTPHTPPDHFHSCSAAARPRSGASPWIPTSAASQRSRCSRRRGMRRGRRRWRRPSAPPVATSGPVLACWERRCWRRPRTCSSSSGSSSTRRREVSRRVGLAGNVGFVEKGVMTGEIADNDKRVWINGIYER